MGFNGNYKFRFYLYRFLEGEPASQLKVEPLPGHASVMFASKLAYSASQVRGLRLRARLPWKAAWQGELRLGSHILHVDACHGRGLSRKKKAAEEPKKKKKEKQRKSEEEAKKKKKNNKNKNKNKKKKKKKNNNKNKKNTKKGNKKE